MASIITTNLFELLQAQFKLDIEGIHGARHWARVHRNAMWIAEELVDEVDTRVLEYFAFLHDSQRTNDNRDPGHGSRAAEFAREIRKQHIPLEDDAFYVLLDALIGHSNTRHHENLTIQACWDADRLDLGRIGITPDRNQLGTTAAKALIWKCVPSQLHVRTNFKDT